MDQGCKPGVFCHTLRDPPNPATPPITLSMPAKPRRSKRTAHSATLINAKLSSAAEQEAKDNRLVADLFVTACGYFAQAAWHSLAARTLAEHVLIYCVDGSGWVRSSGRTLPVVAGDVFICPAGVEHGYGSNQKQPWSIYWLHFSGHASDQVLSFLSWRQDSVPVSLGQDESLKCAMRSLIANYAERDGLASIFDAAVALRQMIQCWKAHSTAAPRVPREVQRVLALLRENYKTSYSVEELAQVAGWSASYFARSFQRVTGRSPIEYLVRLRVKHAADRLMTSSDSVRLIAEHVGYEDPFYFSRLFRAVTGLGPREFRRLMGGG